MKDIALHLLEVCENSIKANSNSLFISFEVFDRKICFSVKDNGDGIDSKKLKSLFSNDLQTNKFSGRGLRLLKNDCENSGGKFKINLCDKGTCVNAEFILDFSEKIIGDLPSVVSALLTEEKLYLSFEYVFKGKVFSFNSTELKKILGEEKLYLPKAVFLAKNFIKENIEKLNGGLAI